MRFNELLKSLRKARGLTQDQMATQLGISRQALSRWEQGRFMPDVGSLGDVAKVLNVPVGVILYGYLIRCGTVKPPQRQPDCKCQTCMMNCVICMWESLDEAGLLEGGESDEEGLKS